MKRARDPIVSAMAVLAMAVLAQAFRPPVFAQVGLTDRGGPENAAPPQGANAIPIVETVGCLVAEPNDVWSLARATEPARAGRAGFSRPDEVKTAEARGLGSLQLRLIGMFEMHPEQHKGHKVLVKGLLIKDAAGQRVNVTSLTTVGASCGA
jgi:hypothetical protein